MNHKISIDENTGNVCFFDFKIDASVKIEDLPSLFEIGEELDSRIGTQKVKCRFAKTAFQEDNLKTTLSLRFENKILSKVFIELGDSMKKYEGKEFYHSVNERILLHRNWLLERDFSCTEDFNSHNWGEVAITRDKSENVFISIFFN